MTLALSEHFDRSYFVKTTDATFLQRMFIRLSTVFHLPTVIMSTFLAKRDTNWFMKNKDCLSGVMNTSSSKPIPMPDIKDLSKARGASINDVVMCSLTTAMHSVFKEKGDLSEQMKIIIPANIRFGFYPNRESVKFENIFAAIPLTVPLTESMEAAYQKIRNITKQLRNSLGNTYCVYAISFWSSLLLPHFLVRKTIVDCGAKFTIGFSNVCGPIKPFEYKCPVSGKKILNLSSQTYINPAGKLGFILCAISQTGNLRLTLSSDDKICDEQTNRKILQSVYMNIVQEIQNNKNGLIKDKKNV